MPYMREKTIGQLRHQLYALDILVFNYQIHGEKTELTVLGQLTENACSLHLTMTPTPAVSVYP